MSKSLATIEKEAYDKFDLYTIPEGATKVGISGSRKLDTGSMVELVLSAYQARIENLKLILGRFPLFEDSERQKLKKIEYGADYVAATWAHYHKIDYHVYEPNYNKYSDNPKVAPLKRNTLIASECDILVAFWDGVSTGTWDTIKKVRNLGKPVHTYWWKEPPLVMEFNGWQLKLDYYEKWLNRWGKEKEEKQAKLL